MKAILEAIASVLFIPLMVVLCFGAFLVAWGQFLMGYLGRLGKRDGS